MLCMNIGMLCMNIGMLCMNIDMLRMNIDMLCMNIGMLCMHVGIVSSINAIDMLEILCMLNLTQITPHTPVQVRPLRYVKYVSIPYMVWQKRIESALYWSFLQSSSHLFCKKLDCGRPGNHVAKLILCQRQQKKFLKLKSHKPFIGKNCLPISCADVSQVLF